MIFFDSCFRALPVPGAPSVFVQFQRAKIRFEGFPDALLFRHFLCFFTAFRRCFIQLSVEIFRKRTVLFHRLREKRAEIIIGDFLLVA